MIVTGAYTFRLQPTPDQEAFLLMATAACRALYNDALQQRRDAGPDWSPCTLSKVTSTAPAEALSAALADLDHAFARHAEGRGPYPRFRHRHDMTGFRLPAVQMRRYNRRRGAIHLADAGWVKLRGWRPLGGKMTGVRVYPSAGHWFVSISWKVDIDEPGRSNLPPIGIDGGSRIFAALSNGKTHKDPPSLRRVEKKLQAARAKRLKHAPGTASRRKAGEQVLRLKIKVANCHHNFFCKTARTIAADYGKAVIEAPELPNWSAREKRKPGVNWQPRVYGLYDKWNLFAARLEEALRRRGGDLIQVSRAKTSQRCSQCWCRKKANRKSQARFECVSCGYTANADRNAALVILKTGIPEQKTGRGNRPKRLQNPAVGRQEEPVQALAWAIQQLRRATAMLGDATMKIGIHLPLYLR